MLESPIRLESPMKSIGFFFKRDRSDVKNPLIQKRLKQMCSGERWARLLNLASL